MARVNIVTYDSFEEVNYYNPDNHVGHHHYVGIEHLEKRDWHCLSLSIDEILKKYNLIPDDKGQPYTEGLRDAWIEGDDLCLLWRKSGPSGVKMTKERELAKHGCYGFARYNPPRYETYEVDIYAYYNYIIRINLLNFVWDSKFFCQSKTEEEAQKNCSIFQSDEEAEATIHFTSNKIPVAKTLAKHQDAKFALFHGVKIPIASWTPQIREYEIPKKLFENLVLLCQGKATLSAIGEIEPLKF